MENKIFPATVEKRKRMLINGVYASINNVDKLINMLSEEVDGINRGRNSAHKMIREKFGIYGSKEVVLKKMKNHRRKNEKSN